MAKQFHNPSKKIKDLPKKRELKPEFKKGKSEYIICPVGGEVYYDKAWHHALERDKHLSDGKNIKFVVCPADKMIKNKQFEGQIILENVPEFLRSDLFNLIENIGRQAFRRDPLDRVISIKDKKNIIEIQTTENQLAVRIAKKIKDSFKNKMLDAWEVKHSHREDPTRVRIVWKNL